MAGPKAESEQQGCESKKLIILPNWRGQSRWKARGTSLNENKKKLALIYNQKLLISTKLILAEGKLCI